MIKYTFFLLFTIVSVLNVFGQEKEIKQLESKLEAANPKEKIGIYLELANLAQTYSESVSYSERALAIANEIKDINLQASVSFSLGLLHYFEGRYLNAEKSFLDALAFNKNKEDQNEIAKNYYWLALTTKYWGKYRNAAEYAQLALDMYEKLKSEEGIIETTLVFGYIYQAWGNQKQAEVYFNKALAKIGKKEDNNFAYAILGKGNTYFYSGKPDSAKLFFDQSNKVFTKNAYKYGQAISLRDLAHFYILKKDFKKAESSIDYSLKLLKSINNNRGISEVYVLKGDMYAKKGNYSRAIELYLAGQKLAIQMELQEEIVKNYKLISNSYEAKKDYPKALKYYKLYSDLKDSVFTSETFEQLSEMQTKYETEKKEKENRVLKAENEIKQSTIEKQYILVFAIIFVLGLATALAVIFFKGREKEKKNNQVLEEQKREIEFSHEQITASINYASRIQGALLPEKDFFKRSFYEHFILFRPRDVVSGDFYWLKQIENQFIVVVADCTGHGVPGAFMSLLGISFLNEVIISGKQLEPSVILEKLREMVKTSLKQDISDHTTKDGMDMAICIINTDTNELQFAGANMPLYLIRQGKLEITKGINNPIGVYLKEKPFETNRIPLQQGDTIYLYTDGYMDQFGGKYGEKFKVSNFRDALLAIHSTEMPTQKQLLENIFDEWKSSNHVQTDDVLVFGLKI